MACPQQKYLLAMRKVYLPKAAPLFLKQKFWNPTIKENGNNQLVSRTRQYKKKGGKRRKCRERERDKRRCRERERIKRDGRRHRRVSE